MQSATPPPFDVQVRRHERSEARRPTATAAGLLALVLWITTVSTSRVVDAAPTATTVGASTPVGDGNAVAVEHLEVAYRLPVDAPVLRPFESTSPFGAGHRGVDLAAAAGTAVHAAASGVIAFTGTVAGSAWVSIDHPDGIRTTYGDLAEVFVRSGADVAAGQAIGSVGTAPHESSRDDPALHWGARRGGEYLDPLSLVGALPWVPSLVGEGGWRPDGAPDVPRYEAWDGEHSWGFVPSSPRAEGPGWVLPPNPNHVIGVAGLGTHTRSWPLNLSHLGYELDDITYLSYAGRTDQVGDPDDPRRDQLPYSAEDTWNDVHTAAERLRDQLRAQWARNPGQAVDLVGHSLGGFVISYYLLTMHDPADPTLPPIAHVATIASPLQGADAADAAANMARNPMAAKALGVVDAWVQELSLDAAVLDDLATHSDAVAEVESGWKAANDDVYAGPLATGTQVLTLGATQDVVVPEHRSGLPGSEHVVLSGNHMSVQGDEATRIVLQAFLADEPVPGESGGWGHWLSYGLSGVVQGVGYHVGYF